MNNAVGRRNADPQQFPRTVRPMYTLQRVAIFSLLSPIAAKLAKPATDKQFNG